MDINTPQFSENKKNKKPSWFLTIILILLFSFLSIVGTYSFFTIYQEVIEKEEDVLTEGGEEIGIIDLESRDIDIYAYTYTYTNTTYGFSIQVPQKTYGLYSRIDLNPIPIPIKILEDGNTIHIVQEYTYVSDKQNNNVYEKVTIDLDFMKKVDYMHDYGWTFHIKDIYSVQDLENFLKEVYGQACKLGGKKESKQDGVFDVQIEGFVVTTSEGIPDFGSPDSCYINYGIEFKYSPEKNKAITWKTGQAYNFFYDTAWGSLDEKMVESFIFE